MVTYHVCMICRCPYTIAYCEVVASTRGDGYMAIDCAHESLMGFQPGSGVINGQDRVARCIDVALLHRVQREAKRLAKSRAAGHDRRARAREAMRAE